MKYLVSYDLKAAVKDYEAIDKAIKDDKQAFKKAFKPLASQWVVQYTGKNAESLYKHLNELFSPVDVLLVVCLDNDDWHADNTTCMGILRL